MFIQYIDHLSCPVLDPEDIIEAWIEELTIAIGRKRRIDGSVLAHRTITMATRI
jgi:hypothetical protein